MWGFVSVMLALLFLFLPVTSHPLRSIPVDQAVAGNSTALAGALREDAMQISLTRDGRLFFRNNQIMIQDLLEELRKGIRNGAEKRIYLNMDARSKYGDTIAVLDQIRLAGVKDISFLTQKPYY